jgi:zinc/manganese transport system substrate-binding protein
VTNFLKLLFAAALCAAAIPAHAALKIFTCEPEWAALARELGADKVSVSAATTAQQDPHHIEARPSLIARLRQADLVVCTGAELEIGWLPVLLRQAGNAKVQPGQPGYFEAATFVQRLDVPRVVDRSMGDVHASGNPHIHTDPRRIGVVAEKLAERLAQLDAANAAGYRSRHQEWALRWQQAIATWTARAASIKGTRLVSHHKDWTYLYDWLGLIDAGELEPKPGLPPSAAHLAALKAQLVKTPAHMIIRTPYQDARPSEWLARETGIKAVVLPYTVGGTPQAKDLYALFDETVARLLDAAQ